MSPRLSCPTASLGERDGSKVRMEGEKSDGGARESAACEKTEADKGGIERSVVEGGNSAAVELDCEATGASAEVSGG